MPMAIDTHSNHPDPNPDPDAVLKRKPKPKPAFPRDVTENPHVGPRECVKTTQGAVSWVKRGEVVAVPNVGSPKDDRVFVLARCETPAGYYCATCRVHMANEYNLEVHVGQVLGPHHVACWCRRHGYEAGTAPSTFQLPLDAQLADAPPPRDRQPGEEAGQ